MWALVLLEGDGRASVRLERVGFEKNRSTGTGGRDTGVEKKKDPERSARGNAEMMVL